MQKFFNDTLAIAGGEYSGAKWRYAHAGLQRNLQTLTKYYHNTKHAVLNQHILVRLLRSLNVNMQMPLDRFYALIDDKALTLGRTFKMTSPINVGALYKGAFYGKGSYEILWANDDAFIPDVVHEHWKSAQPIQVLLHTQSDLNLNLPNGQGENFFEGVSVIKINIPMLAVMYRAFCLEQYYKGLHGDGMETASQFVSNYVLPSMLPSQLDMSLFNRFLNMARGAPQTSDTQKHAIHVNDYTRDVDSFFTELLDYMDKGPRTYSTILQLIPAVHQRSMFEALRLPDVAETRQVRWAMLLARIDAIDLLTLAAYDGGRTRNQSDNNYFLRQFKMLQTGGILDSLPEEVRDSTQRKISDVSRRMLGD